MTVPFASHLPFQRIAERFGTPVYVIDLDLVRERLRRLQAAFPASECDLFYSVKANPNPVILRAVHEAGLGVDACSAGDLWLADQCGFSPERITFTGVALPDELLGRLHGLGVQTNLDSASELRRWAALSPSRPIGLRVAPGVNAGFSEHCRGGLWGGKLGVAVDDVPVLVTSAADRGVVVRGLHMHLGSGMLTCDPVLKAVDRLLPLFEELIQLEYLNVGGGFGTSYHDDEVEIPLDYLAIELRERVRHAAEVRGRPIRIQAEPGEFVAAPAGYLLAQVTVKKIWQRGDECHEALILDASMNHYPAGVLYGSMNRVYLVHAPDAPAIHAYDIYGNTNQSGDRFGGPRQLPEVAEGDLLVFGSCGAYAASRAATFNEHPLAAEVVVSNGSMSLATRRQTFEELFGRALSAQERLCQEADRCSVMR